MALYYIEYDLRKQRDYQKLYDVLNALGATRILESLWALKHSNTTCVLLRDHFKSFIDKDDVVIVSQISDWAYSGKTLATIPNTAD